MSEIKRTVSTTSAFDVLIPSFLFYGSKIYTSTLPAEFSTVSVIA